MSWEFSLTGLLVGGFVGLTGMGGGSLVAPILILLLGMPVLPAVGSGLIFAAVTQSIGGVQHARQRAVDFRTVGALALGSVPASIAAAWGFSRVANSSLPIKESLTDVLGVVLLVVAVSILLRNVVTRGTSRVGGRRIPGWLLATGGAFVGVMTGVTSVGSGSLTTAFLSVTGHQKGQRVVGTVLVHAMLLTLAAGLTHMALGDVNLALVGALLLGSIPGVLLGSRVTAWISEAQMRTALGFGLLFLSLAILLPGGKEAPAKAVAERAPAATAYPLGVIAPTPSASAPAPLPEPAPARPPARRGRGEP